MMFAAWWYTVLLAILVLLGLGNSTSSPGASPISSPSPLSRRVRQPEERRLSSRSASHGESVRYVVGGASGRATTSYYNLLGIGACECGAGGAGFSWTWNLGHEVYTVAANPKLYYQGNTPGRCSAGCGLCFEVINSGISAHSLRSDPANAGRRAIFVINDLCPEGNGNEAWCTAPGTLNSYGYENHFDILGTSHPFGENTLVDFAQVECPGFVGKSRSGELGGQACQCQNNLAGFPEDHLTRTSPWDGDAQMGGMVVDPVEGDDAVWVEEDEETAAYVAIPPPIDEVEEELPEYTPSGPPPPPPPPAGDPIILGDSGYEAPVVVADQVLPDWVPTGPEPPPPPPGGDPVIVGDSGDAAPIVIDDVYAPEPIEEEVYAPEPIDEEPEVLEALPAWIPSGPPPPPPPPAGDPIILGDSGYLPANEEIETDEESGEVYVEYFPPVPPVPEHDAEEEAVEVIYAPDTPVAVDVDEPEPEPLPIEEAPVIAPSSPVPELPVEEEEEVDTPSTPVDFVDDAEPAPEIPVEEAPEMAQAGPQPEVDEEEIPEQPAPEYEPEIAESGAQPEAVPESDESEDSSQCDAPSKHPVTVYEDDSGFSLTTIKLPADLMTPEALDGLIETTEDENGEKTITIGCAKADIVKVDANGVPLDEDDA